MIIKKLFNIILMLILWTLEWVARIIWLLLPLGLHVFILQMRQKVDRLPALTGYFDPESTWQMVYDGVVLVNTAPNALYKRFDNTKNWFIKTRWYWLVLTVLVAVGSLAYIVYKLH